MSPESCIPAELAEVEDEEKDGEDEEAHWQSRLSLLHLLLSYLTS